MMKKNSMTLLGAAVLASGIFYVVNNPNLFMSSILSLQEQEFITTQWRDIAYKTNSGYVDIFLAEKMEMPTNIEFMISFDKTTITIDQENLSGQGTRTYSKNDGEINILSILPKNMDKTQSLILLPFTGDKKDILLSEAMADGKRLSIWSLNEIQLHSQ